MKKIIMLMMLLLTPVVFAAQYGITITPNLKSTITTGDSFFGNIVIQPTIVNITMHDLNETVNKQIILRDTVRNSLGYAITTGDRILVQNEVYMFSQVGTYEIKRLNDSVNIFNINVIAIPDASLKLEMQQTYFKLYGSYDYTINSLTEKTLNISMNYSMFQEPQQYILPLKFKLYNEIVKEIDHTFNLTALYKFNVSASKCANEMPILSSGTLCDFTITNLANAMLDIKTTSNRFSRYFYFPETIGVFPGGQKTFSIYYDLSTDVPRITNDTMNITFSSGGYSQSLSLPILFTDTVAPGFRNFTMTDIEVLRPFSAVVEVIDNYNISYAESVVYKSGPEGWSLYEKKDLIPIRFNVYNFSFKPVTTGRYKLELRAKDFGENINITTWEFVVNPMNSFSSERNIKLGKNKLGKYLSRDFGYLSYPSGLEARVKILNYGATGDCSWSMKITNLDTNNEQFVRSVNETFQLSEVGNYTIGFSGSCLTPGFDGALEFAVPDYHSPVNDISFTGEVINYTIPATFTDKEWNNGRLSCEVSDTGDIATSKYRCMVEYPLTAGEMNLVPVSQDAYQDTIGAKETEIEKWKDKNSGKLAWIWLMICVSLSVMIYAGFMLYMYPDMYFKAR
jgi:hypothetical protein